jgi:hypothetical protein
MEKKNLSKELENISSVFLSTEKKAAGPYLDHGFSAVQKRDETCLSCANMLEGSSGNLKCRIFTFENEKHGVTHLDSITPNHAHYCNHFTPLSTEKNGTLKEVKSDFSHQKEDDPEIEEAVTFQKKITYPDTEGAQQRMKKTIVRFMESGYSIKHVELGRTTEVSGPKKKKSREEKITFSVRKPEES